MNSKVLIYLKEIYEQLNANFEMNLLAVESLEKINRKEIISNGSSK